jgi:hypothetical protein
MAGAKLVLPPYKATAFTTTYAVYPGNPVTRVLGVVERRYASGARVTKSVADADLLDGVLAIIIEVPTAHPAGSNDYLILTPFNDDGIPNGQPTEKKLT